MDTKYSDAMMVLESDIDDAIRHAEDAGLKSSDIAGELRRKAREVDMPAKTD